MIEHRGHQIQDPDLEVNTPGAKSIWKAQQYSKIAISAFPRRPFGKLQFCLDLREFRICFGKNNKYFWHFLADFQ